MLVNVDFKVIGHERPLPDIKLSLIVQKWLLDVFLNHPGSGGDGLGEQELLDILQILKNLNTTSLITILRLHKPYVLRAMLHRRPFFPGIAFGYVFESIYEWIEAVVRVADGYEVGRWGCVEYRIILLPRILITFIIVLQRPN